LLDGKTFSLLYGCRMKPKSETEILRQAEARDVLLHGGTVASFVRPYHPNLRFEAFRAYIGAVRDALLRPRKARQQLKRAVALKREHFWFAQSSSEQIKSHLSRKAARYPATQSATRNSTVVHMMLWFAFTMKLASFPLCIGHDYAISKKACRSGVVMVMA
jgi:hypothetical protein